MLLVGEDDTEADVAGSVNGEGLGCRSKPAGERRGLAVLPNFFFRSCFVYLIFLNFKRQINVRHLSIQFLGIELTSFRSHQLTALSAS